MSRFVPLLLLAGCALQPTECTLIAAASVVVTVVDVDGEPMPDAEVTWEVDGEAPQPCDALSDATWVCGYEVSGDIRVSAGADGYAVASEVVTVETDECHVIQEEVELVLEIAIE